MIAWFGAKFNARQYYRLYGRGLGPGSDATCVISMEVPHSDWNQNIKRRNEMISVLLMLIL